MGQAYTRRGIVQEMNQFDHVFLIGPGEVGRRLAVALEGAGCAVSTVSRTSGWRRASYPSDHSTRLVAVREEDLGAVIDRLPLSLRERTVLVQNGFLEPVHGDLGPVTRGLIYFTSKAEFFRVLCSSPFHGPLAAGLVDRLGAGGLDVELIDDRAAFLRAMIVKGVWNAVVGLPLAVHGVDLATYRVDRREELEALVDESVRAAGAEYEVTPTTAETIDKILETTVELGWVTGGAKALNWRNGALALLGRRHGIPTPVNDRLLRAVGHDPERAAG